jgi:transcriptional regulator with XRE-family HTH domain
LRQERGWSLERLAKEISDAGNPMTLNMISKIERGQRRIDVDELDAFAAAFEVPINRMLAPLSALTEVERDDLERKSQTLSDASEVMRHARTRLTEAQYEVVRALKEVKERDGDEAAFDEAVEVVRGIAGSQHAHLVKHEAIHMLSRG